ncbi:uncharacterized protein N7443_000153 [Penicillium atrosanguineum]|uniref:uncharacterized protein n=1 Tax=Penicillium atrosanguineum TaxID=1132637 RepID=UPI002392D424|nr:uncharacterized protein N7443_000153 [Penicillium atrosanguineum]KAJ5313269.1 hypothetical protein N7443_000153 [Penicillium atrosanguineum]
MPDSKMLSPIGTQQDEEEAFQPPSLKVLLWTQLSHQRAAFEVGYVALAVP